MKNGLFLKIENCKNPYIGFLQFNIFLFFTFYKIKNTNRQNCNYFEIEMKSFSMRNLLSHTNCAARLSAISDLIFLQRGPNILFIPLSTT